ncbi:hypothetical protein N7519_011628 [Penicillium mononematosum]|uniref:uncharacterized protein n=1 Tax=Penicillium mononematosum TaxID=268346 RepID=UPI0025490814|nr:uncharacterized protein N7519_011628 [Penicillium mononematosum]KAJ6181167.1 hypothetical protein N7519_011628 [Penicillium mononematosum]
MPYRFEIAAQGRAGCKATDCAKDKVKITKGEFRVGTWVDGQGFQGWSWRHWGCFTPKQIVNVKKDLTEVSEDPDFSRLDGFDEMSEELQDKIRKAIEVGHVEDEEWRGDVQCNRPGKVGMRVKASKAKAKETKDAEKSSPGKKHDLTDSENAAEEPAKKKQTRAKKAADDDEAIAEATVVENEPNMGKKRGRGRPRKNTSEDQVAAADVKVEPKKPGRPRKKTSDEDSPDAQTEVKVAPKRAVRGKKVSEDEGADADTEMTTEPTEPKTRATRGKKITKDEAASADIEPKQPTKRATRDNKATTEAKVADKESNELDPADEDKPTKKASMTRATRAKKDVKKDVSPVEKDTSSADNETAATIESKNTRPTRATRAKKDANKDVPPVDKDISSADNKTASGAIKKSTTRARAANGKKTTNGSKATNDAKNSGSDTSKDEHAAELTEKPKRTRGANNKTNGNNTTSGSSRKASVDKATQTPPEEDAEIPDAIKEKPKTRARKPAAAKITIESAKTTEEPAEASTEQSVKDTIVKSEDGPKNENASAEAQDEPTVETAEKPVEGASEKPLESPLKPVKAEYTDDDF